MVCGVCRCESVLLWFLVSCQFSWPRSDVCDNGKYLIEKDLGGPQNHKCLSGHTYAPQEFSGPAGEGNCTDTHTHAMASCMEIDLTYEADIPVTGPYRHTPPKPGEYDYLPPQRWLHLLRRGGVAFLYHPCADEEQVDELRTVAQSCLSYYVMTPYPNLTKEMPLAIVSWGCVYSMKWVEQVEIREWLETLKLRLISSYEGETYNHGLLHSSDSSELSGLCSNLHKKNPKTNPTANTHPPTPPLGTHSSVAPCVTSNRNKSSSDNSELCKNSANNHHQVVKNLQKHNLSLQVLVVLLGIVLLGLMVLLLWKAAVMWHRSRPRKHQKYKSVSNYFPFSHKKDSSVDVALPELGMPKGVGAERQVLLEGSDEDDEF